MPSGPITCEYCGAIPRSMPHVCDPAARAKFQDDQRLEGLAIGASGVADDDGSMNWEEAIARLAGSQAAVRGEAGVAPARRPIKRFGLTIFQWRLLWGVVNWSALLILAGFLIGRHTR